MNIDLEHSLSLHLQKILETTATEPLQKLLGRIAENLALSPLQLAAALLYLDADVIISCLDAFNAHNLLMPTVNTPSANALKKQLATQLATVLQIPEIQAEKYKMVRYRLEIGHNHQVSIEEIKNVLIDESGVDRSQIGHLDIRSNYTLIDLPPGMPPDIFQLLQTVELKQQPLQIKRVNSSRKRPWQRRKSGAQNRAVESESTQITDMQRTV
ncbi:MAG: hypothetical protein HOP02_17035 [Methylococcaceae bacterium]|nr:hypothetical protein [Methylococcaceae bacterium]